MTEHKEALRIFLNKDDKPNGGVTSSQHERYIILMNGSLQEKNEASVLKIKELELRIEELENEGDRSDTNRNYIKGLLKNFHEMHKWNENIINTETEILEDTRLFINVYKNRANWHLRILHACFIVLIGLVWEYYSSFEFTATMSVFMVIASFQTSMLRNLNIPDFLEKEKKIKKLTDEKKKVTKAQDYIYEFIDSQ
uniref:Uncharacterized protein n=1 Tax=viral metagenome TaxID=1070528 RepID=A0A6C0LVP2_9ZZZZ